MFDLLVDYHFHLNLELTMLVFCPQLFFSPFFCVVHDMCISGFVLMVDAVERFLCVFCQVHDVFFIVFL